MKIYIVYGTCGSYDDRTDWNIKAFKDKKEANKFKKKLQSIVEEFYCDMCIVHDICKNKLSEAGDKQAHVFDNGPIYGIEELELT